MGMVVLLVYTVIGGVLFVALESPSEKTHIAQTASELSLKSLKARNRLSSDMQYFFRSKVNVTKLLDHKFIKVMEEYDRNMGYEPASVVPKEKWTLFGGMYYAGTLYTTIGYGDIYTSTVAGKVATCIYSLFGVPLLIVALEGFGSWLFNFMQWLWNSFKKTSRRFVRRASTTLLKSDSLEDIETQPERSSNNVEELLPLEMAIAFLVIWVLMSAGIFCFFESWDFGTSVYYFYISLMTIGLGDITPNHETACGLFFIIFGGLSVFSMSLKVIQMHIEAMFATIIKSIEDDFKRDICAERKKSQEKDARTSLTGLNDGVRLILPQPTDMATDSLEPKEGPDGIKKYEKEMSFNQKMYLKLMSNHQKKLLNEKFETRAKMRNRATQTDNRKVSILIQTEDMSHFMDPVEEEESEEEEQAPVAVVPGQVPRPKPLFSVKKRRKLYIYNTD
uniref:Ion channel n=1 Tax=Panagrellus redivivus TaxID=6233 RepID=A0A7E4ZSE3_PANRE